MKSSSSLLSPELLQANQQLYELRQQTQSHRAEPCQTEQQRPSPDNPPWKSNDTAEFGLTAVEPITKLPPHLGWGSLAVTKDIRIAIKKNQQVPASTERLTTDPLSFRPLADGSYQPRQRLEFKSSETAGKQLRRPLYEETVKHYPSLGVAALKKEQAPPYRVWLMCRYLDEQGKGWLIVQKVREQLTGKESQLRMFGWRRLRQIFGQGHGRYWKWDKENGRIWLFGAANVAANLEVSKLSGKSVLLPVTAVTKGISEFKAHLYGAWHSGRKTSNPISRVVQEATTGVPERSQRHYCKVARIKSQTNIVIGRKYTPEEVQKQAWQRGRAIFRFRDHQGRLGRKGTSYIAWHLSNSYIGPHAQSTKGRMRKINRKLKDLVTKGAWGNGGKKVEKMYHANGKDAGRALNRGRGSVAYWPLIELSRRSSLWTVFSFD